MPSIIKSPSACIGPSRSAVPVRNNLYTPASFRKSPTRRQKKTTRFISPTAAQSSTFSNIAVAIDKAHATNVYYPGASSPTHQPKKLHRVGPFVPHAVDLSKLSPDRLAAFKGAMSNFRSLIDNAMSTDNYAQQPAVETHALAQPKLQLRPQSQPQFRSLLSSPGAPKPVDLSRLSPQRRTAFKGAMANFHSLLDKAMASSPSKLHPATPLVPRRQTVANTRAEPQHTIAFSTPDWAHRRTEQVLEEEIKTRHVNTAAWATGGYSPDPRIPVNSTATWSESIASSRTTSIASFESNDAHDSQASESYRCLPSPSGTIPGMIAGLRFWKLRKGNRTSLAADLKQCCPYMLDPTLGDQYQAINDWLDDVPAPSPVRPVTSPLLRSCISPVPSSLFSLDDHPFETVDASPCRGFSHSESPEFSTQVDLWLDDQKGNDAQPAISTHSIAERPARLSSLSTILSESEPESSLLSSTSRLEPFAQSVQLPRYPYVESWVNDEDSVAFLNSPFVPSPSRPSPSPPSPSPPSPSPPSPSPPSPSPPSPSPSTRCRASCAPKLDFNLPVGDNNFPSRPACSNRAARLSLRLSHPRLSQARLPRPRKSIAKLSRPRPSRPSPPPPAASQPTSSFASPSFATPSFATASQANPSSSEMPYSAPPLPPPQSFPPTSFQPASYAPPFFTMPSYFQSSYLVPGYAVPSFFQPAYIVAPVPTTFPPAPFSAPVVHCPTLSWKIVAGVAAGVAAGAFALGCFAARYLM